MTKSRNYFFLALLCLPFSIQAQQSNRHALDSIYQYYSESNKIDSSIARFVHGDLILGDDSMTYALLDRLTSHNRSLAPLYVHVLDQIVIETQDNVSLGEVIGEYQGDILLNNFAVVVREFIADEKQHPMAPMLKRYAGGIAQDIDLQDVRTYKTYSKWLERACRSHEERLFVQRFLKMVKSESK